ncbi:MAG: peptidoglycan D,D-transpeptidase FtsI family protein [Anaerolineae bacterium]
MNGSDRRGEIRGRLYLVVGALALFGVVLVAQLARWQLVHGRSLAEAANEEAQQMRAIDARRGTIYSADGRPFAIDVYASSISAAPGEVDDAYELADRLFPMVGTERDELVQSLRADVAWVPIADEVPLRIADEIISWDEPGVYVEPRLSRSYPDIGLMEPLLGFVNRARDGFYGIEGQYDSVLRGQPGARLGELDVFGQDVPFGTSVLEPAVNGGDVYLTIDSRVQYVLWRELRDGLEKYQATSGSIIVIDPRTGALIGAVSLPSYDPNSYESAEPERFDDPLVSQEYEPGSVFKVITMAAGLDAGVVDPDTVYEDKGEFEIAGVTVRNWDRLAHGNVTMAEVLEKSLNTGASYVSTTLGAERFYQYVAAFGFGRASGVDLQGEVAGTVKAPGDGRWYEADLATNSFGQGLACTPLQMVASVAAIANGGVLMQPYVVSAVSRDGQLLETEPVAVRQVVSPETADTLTQMLMRVVEAETVEAGVPGYDVAGKTGTAQIPIPGGYHPSDTIASFVGFLPAEEPQLCILVKIDRPQASQWGSQVAAPVFRRVAAELVLLLGIEPSPTAMAQESDR